VRNAFIRTLVELAERDTRIHLVVGDLGFGIVEPFVERFPERYLNAGVAEQNMTGIAAGMAMCGKIVFTYSIANFPTLRCLEQIRNDVCYHNADVKIVSVGGGLGYGSLGVSHHATEDLAILRSLPRMAVVAPGDPWEAEMATRAAVSHDGPCYLRLGKSGDPQVHHNTKVDFRLGQAIPVRQGDGICLIATGAILDNVVKAADRLAQSGVRCRVLSMHTVKPLDEKAVLSAARETGAIVTVEEHSILGGLGSAVAELLSESSHPRVLFKRLGLPPDFTTRVGSQEYLRSVYGLSVDGILGLLGPVVEFVRSKN
jgi:transketolase